MSEVVWKTLGDICNIMNGKDYKKEGDGEVPVYGSGGIMTYIDKAMSSKPSVLLPRKGSLNNVFYVDTPFWTVDTIYWTDIKDNTVPKYFYYYMTTINLEAMNIATGAVPSMTKAILNKIVIPVPKDPHRQQQIVNQLDTFTSLISRLESELELRQKQYEHYREELLSFEGDKEVEWKSIGSCSQVEKGNGVEKKDFIPEGVGCIHYGQIYQHYPLFAFKTNKFVSHQVAAKAKKACTYDIIMTSTSENVEDICKCVVWLGEETVAVSAHAAIITTSLNPKYFAYCTLTNSFFKEKKKYARGTKVIEIRKDQIESIIIPVPKDPHRQQQIVDKLDMFEQLIAALKREIALRKKQYTYYREKLLTFE